MRAPSITHIKSPLTAESLSRQFSHVNAKIGSLTRFSDLDRLDHRFSKRDKKILKVIFFGFDFSNFDSALVVSALSHCDLIKILLQIYKKNVKKKKKMFQKSFGHPFVCIKFSNDVFGDLVS